MNEREIALSGKEPFSCLFILSSPARDVLNDVSDFHLKNNERLYRDPK
jgi:hypothetical protein